MAFINTILFFPLLLIKDQLKRAIPLFITSTLKFPEVALKVDFLKKQNTLNRIYSYIYIHEFRGDQSLNFMDLI